MRSITFVQAFQYWLKLAALAIPVVFLLLHLGLAGESATLDGAVFDSSAGPGRPNQGLYCNISLLVALLFGTLGLPHVLVRFYTNPDGPSARKTTAIVLGLLALFYLFPTVLGILGRAYTPELATSGNADATVLLLPGRIVGRRRRGRADRDRHRRGVRRVPLHLLGPGGVPGRGHLPGLVPRHACADSGSPRVIATAVPLLLALGTSSLALAGAIGSVFAFTASTHLPAAAAGHLVARAHRGRGRGRHGHRGPDLRGRPGAGGRAAQRAGLACTLWWHSRPPGPCRWRSW